MYYIKISLCFVALGLTCIHANPTGNISEEKSLASDVNLERKDAIETKSTGDEKERSKKSATKFCLEVHQPNQNCGCNQELVQVGAPCQDRMIVVDQQPLMVLPEEKPPQPHAIVEVPPPPPPPPTIIEVPPPQPPSSHVIHHQCLHKSQCQCHQPEPVIRPPICECVPSNPFDHRFRSEMESPERLMKEESVEAHPSFRMHVRHHKTRPCMYHQPMQAYPPNNPLMVPCNSRAAATMENDAPIMHTPGDPRFNQMINEGEMMM